MQADDVRNLQQLIKARSRFDIAILQFVGSVEIADRHAEALSQIADLRTDIAIAYNTQRLAAHFAAAGCRLIPTACMRRDRTREDPTHQHDDFANHQFRHRTGVRKWCIEDRNAALAGCFQFNLVGPDGEAADCYQAVSRSKNLFGQLRAGTNTDNMR